MPRPDLGRAPDRSQDELGEPLRPLARERSLGGVTLPFVFETELRTADYERLARLLCSS